MPRMSYTLLLRLAALVVTSTPTRTAAAQRVAPSGVHVLSTTPSTVTMNADTSATNRRRRRQRITRDGLVGMGVGAVTGAAAYGALYLATYDAPRPGFRDVDAAWLTIFAGTGAVAGSLIGVAIGALTGD